jgi:aspartyl-tRNA synthetase
MSLLNAHRLAASRGTCLRSSYLEISRFFRTRHHGITSNCAAIGSGRTIRAFSRSTVLRDAIEPDEKVRKTLADFKATSMSYMCKSAFRYSLYTVRSTPWSNTEKEFIKELSNDNPSSQKVEVAGYISTRRDVNKKLSFTVLRSATQSWCIQLVSTSNTGAKEAEAHERMRSLKEWTPVLVRGILKSRQAAKTDNHLGIKLVTNHEMVVEHVEQLNQISDDTIIKEDTVFSPEQRHLQLRTSSELRDNILFRAKALGKARLHLSDREWREIETPILFKSTPEGAREFLVPTRQKGLAYALPQSPQQYKQILMASGFNKYFQIARCFRDEDLRADRQPEFTQLDMEMAFAGEEDVMAETEELLKVLWSHLLEQDIGTFPRMTYQEAMSSYGSDKPDLRFKATVSYGKLELCYWILTVHRFMMLLNTSPPTSLARSHHFEIQ